MTVSPPLNPILMELSGNGSLAGRDRAGAFTATGSGALRYAPAPGAWTNWARNPILANDTQFWTGYGGTGVTNSRSTSETYQGYASFRTQVDNPNGHRIVGHNPPNAIPVAPGELIAFSIAVKLPAGLVFRPYLTQNSMSAGGFITDAVGPTFVATGDWQVVTHSVTANAAAAYAYAQIGYVSGWVSGTTEWYATALQFTRGSATPGALVVGGVAGAVWLDPLTGQLGTANTSPSVSRAVFWVEEATTNLCRNPSFEVDTTGWGGVTATLTRDTTSAYIGGASLKVERNNAIGYLAAYASTVSGSVSAGDQITISARYRSPVVLANMKLTCTFKDASNATIGSVYIGAIPNTSTNWQQGVFTVGVTAPALTSYITFSIEQDSNGTVGDAFFVDCVQIEKKAYATSYCDGSLGTGYTWAGTAHASASSRVASGVAFPSAARFTSINGAAVLRQSQLVAQSDRLWDFGAYSGVGFGDSLTLITSNVAGTTMQMLAYTGAPAGSVSLAGVTPGTSQTLWAKWSATLLSLAINAGAWTNGTRTITPTGVSMSPTYPNISVGKPGTQTGKALGSILAGPFITYEAPLSDARRAMVNAAIDSNGATDLWTLFEEWEGIIQPADLLALQSGQATAGVTAELAPIDLLPLQSGQATAGVTAEVDALDMSMMGEELVATARRPFPYLVTWRSP